MQYVNRNFLLLLIIGIALLGLKAPAYAEQLNNSVKDCIEQPDACEDGQAPNKKQAEQERAEPAKVGINAWDIIKMIFATVFVVALLYFLLKFISKRSKTYKSSRLVENLGGTALGTNRSVQLIKVGNRILVVGVGENIQLLKELTDSEECSQIISEYNDKMEQLVQPSDIVTKVLQRRKMNQSNENKGNHFQSLLKQQLDKMTTDRQKLFDEMEKEGTDER